MSKKPREEDDPASNTSEQPQKRKKLSILENDVFEWKVSSEATEWANQLMRLYYKTRGVNREESNAVDNDVVSVGADILALGMTRGIDRDSKSSLQKAIFLRKEQRIVATLAVDAMFGDTPVVAIPGSPGAGKTFATMAAVVAQLLFRGFQVYRITSKDTPKLHFFRCKNGKVTAWEAPFPVDELWNASELSQTEGIVTVIDPSETKSPVRQDMLSQPSIKIPSDNPEKHYENLIKTNILIHTAPPSGREALVISRCIVTAVAGSVDDRFRSAYDLPDLDEEVKRRILLVGPYPRYIVNYKAFKARVQQIKDKVESLVLTVNDTTLAALNIMKELQVESGKLQSTYPGNDRQVCSFVLHPLCIYLIAQKQSERAQDFVNVKSKAEFGWFFERHICQRLLVEGFEVADKKLGFPRWNKSQKTQLTRSAAKPKRYSLDKRKAVFAKGNTHAAGYDGITSIEEKTFLVLPTSNFPVADFALSSAWFVHAKVGDTVHFKCSTVLRFLERLGYVEQDGDGRWSSKRGTEKEHKDDIKVDLDLVGVDNLDTPCIFEGTKSEYECVKKHLNVSNVDTGVAQAGDALCKSVEEALEAYPEEKRQETEEKWTPVTALAVLAVFDSDEESTTSDPPSEK